jgi:hypothetical protein
MFLFHMKPKPNLRSVSGLPALPSLPLAPSQKHSLVLGLPSFVSSHQRYCNSRACYNTCHLNAPQVKGHVPQVISQVVVRPVAFTPRTVSCDEARYFGVQKSLLPFLSREARLFHSLSGSSSSSKSRSSRSSFSQIHSAPVSGNTRVRFSDRRCTEQQVRIDVKTSSNHHQGTVAQLPSIPNTQGRRSNSCRAGQTPI